MFESNKDTIIKKYTIAIRVTAKEKEFLEKYIKSSKHKNISEFIRVLIKKELSYTKE